MMGRLGFMERDDVLGCGVGKGRFGTSSCF